MALDSTLKLFSRLFGALLLVLAAFTLFYLANREREITEELLSEGQITEATVIAHLRSTHKRNKKPSGRSLAPIFQFFDEDGISQTVVQHYYSKPASYAIGESVRLHYLPGRPGLGRVDTFRQLHLATLLYGCGGLLFLLFAFLSVWNVNLLPVWLKRFIKKHQTRTANQKMTLPHRIIGALVFFVIGAGIIFFTHQVYKDIFRLVKEGKQAKATVVGFDVQSHGQYNKYAPIFGFRDETGRQRRVTQHYHSNAATYTVNEQVDFLYLPDEEGGQVDTLVSLFGVSLWGFIIGLTFLIGAPKMLFDGS